MTMEVSNLDSNKREELELAYDAVYKFIAATNYTLQLAQAIKPILVDIGYLSIYSKYKEKLKDSTINRPLKDRSKYVERAKILKEQQKELKNLRKRIDDFTQSAYVLLDTHKVNSEYEQYIVELMQEINQLLGPQKFRFKDVTPPEQPTNVGEDSSTSSN